MKTIIRPILLPLVLLSFLPSVARAAEPEKGWYGFVVDIKAPGISFNPVVREITIAKVIPGSPTAAKGVAVGDSVTLVEGLPVPGSKARDLRAAITKKVGETLHLGLKRPNGETYTAAIVAAPRPKDL